jgi:hypothetical protein
MENLEAKQQAIDLVISFDSMVWDHTKGVSIKALSKDLAIMTVDKIIEEVAESADDEVKFMRIIYWERVKREINNL